MMSKQEEGDTVCRYVTFALFIGRLSWEKPIKVYELPQMQAPLTGTSVQMCVMCVCSLDLQSMHITSSVFDPMSTVR